MSENLSSQNSKVEKKLEEDFNEELSYLWSSVELNDHNYMLLLWQAKTSEQVGEIVSAIQSNAEAHGVRFVDCRVQVEPPSLMRGLGLAEENLNKGDTNERVLPAVVVISGLEGLPREKQGRLTRESRDAIFVFNEQRDHIATRIPEIIIIVGTKKSLQDIRELASDTYSVRTSYLGLDE